MSYLNGDRFKSYLGEDPSYTINTGSPDTLIAKAAAMPRAVALAERRRKMMTPQQRIQQYAQVVSFIKTLPAGKQKQIIEAAKRYANKGVALDGYSGQTAGMGDIASALTAAASIYIGYEGLQAQKDAQKAADKRAAQQAQAQLEYQRAQIRMAEEAAAAANAQKIAQAQAEANKPAMSTGTKVAIGAGVVAAAGAAYVAMN